MASVNNFNKEYVFAQDAVVLSMTYTRNVSLGVMYVTVYESPCLDSAPFKVTLQLVYKCCGGPETDISTPYVLRKPFCPTGEARASFGLHYDCKSLLDPRCCMCDQFVQVRV